MAYVLGFFAADGYITVSRRGAHFWCIQITDRKLLEAIRRVVQAEHVISTRTRKVNEKDIYRLQVGSRDMCEDLRRLGMRERKTKRMAMPQVPEQFFPAFVRGYFDGDGNVWSGNTHKGRKTATAALMTVFTSSSLGFLKQLRERLHRTGLNGGSLYKAGGSYARLQFSTLDSLKLYNFMYNACGPMSRGLFLQRKRKVFEKYKKMRE